MSEDTRSQLERDFDEGMLTTFKLNDPSSMVSRAYWEIQHLSKLVTILQKERDTFRSNWRASERAYKEADPFRALAQIAGLLELVVDKEKKILRMVDTERAQVYKTHLGEKLTSVPPAFDIVKAAVHAMGDVK